MIKSWVKRAARAAGYEIISRDLLRRDPIADIRVVLGRDPKVILDVGANHGQTVDEYLQAFPAARIDCFEPTTATFARLHERLHRHSRVRLFPYAIGATQEMRSLYQNSGDQTNSLLPTNALASDHCPPGTIDPVGAETVTVKTLDQLYETSAETIDLLKIDTQGFELAVLKGAERLLRQKKVRAIYLEVLFVPLYEGQSWWHDVFHHLADREYRLVDLYSAHRHADGSMKWCDALFTGC